MGNVWFYQHSRMPNEWADRLNAKAVDAGEQPMFKKRGRRPHTEKYPELIQCLADAVKKHEEVRKRKRNADTNGFSQTLQSIVALKNADLADVDAEQIVGPKFSRAWVQGKLKELDAKIEATKLELKRDIKEAVKDTELRLTLRLGGMLAVSVAVIVMMQKIF